MVEGWADLEILQPKVSKIAILKFWPANNLRTVSFGSFLQEEKMFSWFQLTSWAHNFNNLEQNFFQPIGKNRYFRHFNFFPTFPHLHFLICYRIRQMLSFQRFWQLQVTTVNRKWPKTGNFQVFLNFGPLKGEIFKFFLHHIS